LQTLINDTCTSEFAQQILAGNADIKGLPVDEYTKDLLQHLKSKSSPTTNPNHPLDVDTIIQGLKQWPK